MEWFGAIARAVIPRIGVNFVMFPILKTLVIRYLPTNVLNDAKFHFVGVDFVESEILPIELVVEHIINSGDKTLITFVAAYWRAVHAKLLQENNLEEEKDAEYQLLRHPEWARALLDCWNMLGRLAYVTADGRTFIRRHDLVAVFKVEKIRFPITWR
jgi:hypothetical protein